MTIFIDRFEAVFGKMSGTNPVFIVVVCRPIAALALVWRHYGRHGVPVDIDTTAASPTLASMSTAT